MMYSDEEIIDKFMDVINEIRKENGDEWCIGNLLVNVVVSDGKSLLCGKASKILAACSGNIIILSEKLDKKVADILLLLHEGTRAHKDLVTNVTEGSWDE